ncbi:hypothetical protein LNV47_24830, partial [Paucibacter sp. DJ4R-1]|nr:hypothetical protein [Paucibacter sp. DJ4R-1]
KELNSPLSSAKIRVSTPEEIVKNFQASQPSNIALSIGFGNSAFLSYFPPQSSLLSQRMFCSIDNIYCIFVGNLNNLSTLIKQYGLSKNINEAMVVIHAYKTLRDRGPYPVHQVLRDLEGSFGFVIYDKNDGTVFTALDADEGVKLYWGIAADGSVVICDDLAVMKASCAKSFAPFPAGCMFHSEAGLGSFEHPKKKVKAMPRIDSEGAMC